MKKIQIFSLISLFFVFLACSSSSDTEPEQNLGPATEHKEGDVSKDNGNGTTTNTVAGIDFHTVHRDFSNEPVVTEPKTMSGTLSEDLIFPLPVERFRVADQSLYAFLQESAFDSQLAFMDLTTGSVVSTHDTDFYLTGFDYNGAIMTVEGSENVNFYKIENNAISDHFFQIPSLNGSKFLSECFLDEDIAFVFDTDKILAFTLANTKQVNSILSVPSFSQIRFSADENHIYVLVSEFDKSSIWYLEKNKYGKEHVLELPGIRANGMDVDANYIYISDSKSDKVVAYNKHTYAASGEFSVTSPNAVIKNGDKLYISIDNEAKVKVYDISFQ